MSLFIAKSDELTSIVQGLMLVKSFFVSSLIVGAKGNGKKTLARYILPDATVVSGNSLDEVLYALESSHELIITDFEKISNYSQLNFDNKRIIATALYQPNDIYVDDLFGYIYEISPLSKRLEDAQLLAEHFIEKATKMLAIETSIKIDVNNLDLSENSKSLKKEIYKILIKNEFDEQDLEGLLFDYFSKNLKGNNDYKDFLYLYERPLIKAGLLQYKSQLKLSNILGINRNTLRKKVNEYDL